MDWTLNRQPVTFGTVIKLVISGDSVVLGLFEANFDILGSLMLRRLYRNLMNGFYFFCIFSC